MKSSTPNLANHQRRGWLLLALCPLVAAIAYMVFAIQAPHPDSWPTLNDSNATWDALRFAKKQHFQLDYDTATISQVTDLERQLAQKNSKGELIYFREKNNKNGPEIITLVEILDPQTRAVTRSIELPNRPTFIGGRFAVSVSKSTLYCVDLDADKLEIKTLDVNSSAGFIIDAQQGRLFWTFVGSPNSSPNPIEIYDIADDGSLLRVHSSNVFNNAVSVDGGIIKLLTADRAFFEVRELSTGKLISSTPVPSEYVQGTSAISLKAGCLAIDTSTGYRFYDPLRNIELEHRLANLIAFNSNEEAERIVVAYDDGMLKRAKIEVYDLASGKVIFTKQTNPLIASSLALKIVNRDTLILQHAQNGLTIDFVDIPTGRLTRRIAPYVWCTWMLPLFCASLALWTVAWLRASAFENGWGWVDVCFLTALAIITLVIRLLSIHMPSDVSRLPFSFLQGIVAGLANVCALWMAMGRTRFTLRILPFLGCMILVISLLNLVFSLTWYDDYRSLLNSSMLYLCKTAVPAIGCYLVYLTLLWFGWSAYNLKSETKTLAINRGVPMRDYFMLTAVLAVLAAVSRNLYPGLAEVFPNMMSFPDFLISFASYSGMSLLTFSNFRIARISSQVIALILFLVVIGYPIAEFNLGTSRVLFATQLQHMLQVIASGVLSTFVYLQIYRLRGWRLGRTNAIAHDGAFDASKKPGATFA